MWLANARWIEAHRMHKLFWLVVACPLFAASSSYGFCQTAGKDGWGPWRYTDYKVAGIEFRSKCLSSSGADSKWAYQFRSRHDRSVDFVEREEEGVLDTPRNEFDAPEMFTLDAGAISPVFEAGIHGTCAQVHELKIEVECVAEHDQFGGLTCFQDANGAQVGSKPVPDNPRYQ